MSGAAPITVQNPTQVRLVIRPIADADMTAVTAIYAHHVRTGFGSFEETPPDAAEMARRRDDYLGRGLPYLVGELNDQVVGYAYASPFRPRSAYRYSIEDSIYVAPEACRHGIGIALLTDLVTRCEQLGYRQMVAVIGDSDNLASIRLHQKAGFVRAGVLHGIGFKHGRWIDSVFMQRALGAGETQPPP